MTSLDMPDWMTFGKIRLSWAQVGNDTVPYNINKGYTVQNYELSDGNVYGNTRSTISVDREIEPERKNSFEVGVDVRFFQNL